MSNLGDLNRHLFEQLGRLNDKNLKGDALKEEMDRSKAMTDVSKQIIDSHNTHLEAVKLIATYKGLGDQKPAELSSSLEMKDVQAN
ncbi:MULTISPECIES: hypothetical protein [Acinetobacter]|uniref:Uncharacterized protein n=1 Tax=Acinetobacter seifertii TaxID=1530123 RepID=A0A7H2PPD2_9GAMM|nr:MULTISPECIES: hypothetical protein [Acinetobacter]MCG7219514.1 hypothetical protein [Acinetobacter sp. AG3]MCU4392823.1 hypothetical protein [Acinetobacter parvus]MDC5039421.1 hypothetical protein [Acinetobacter baumannii]MDR0079192.1 hypothetical protein [Acinetobacter baumannii]QNX04715.1 hypothetical protein IC796_15480 [Acinetobacter seifertii]